MSVACANCRQPLRSFPNLSNTSVILAIGCILLIGWAITCVLRVWLCLKASVPLREPCDVKYVLQVLRFFLWAELCCFPHCFSTFVGTASGPTSCRQGSKNFEVNGTCCDALGCPPKVLEVLDTSLGFAVSLNLESISPAMMPEVHGDAAGSFLGVFCSVLRTRACSRVRKLLRSSRAHVSM